MHEWRDRLDEPFSTRFTHDMGLPCIDLIPDAILTEWIDTTEHDSDGPVLLSDFRPIRIGSRLRITVPREWCVAAGID